MLTRCPIEHRDDGVGTPWLAVAPFDELVASWSVPPERDLEVTVECRRLGTASGVLVLGRRQAGRWTSVSGQSDPLARVEVDVLAASAPLDAFRLSVRGVLAPDAVRLAARTSLRSDRGAPAPTPRSRAIELAVEPISQMAFAGLRPDLDGGGASWCSPTALAMVLRFHGLATDVADTAEAVFDPAYGGCGNWSFNVAHAAERGLDAVVTRLAGLADATELLAAGLPLVASIVAPPGELPGFPLANGTTGHLVVLAGMTPDGDPIVLDPAGETGEVRRVYPAGAFERCWVERAGGIVYLVRPHDHPLPPSAGRW